MNSASANRRLRQHHHHHIQYIPVPVPQTVPSLPAQDYERELDQAWNDVQQHYEAARTATETAEARVEAAHRQVIEVSERNGQLVAEIARLREELALAKQPVPSVETRVGSTETDPPPPEPQTRTCATQTDPEPKCEVPKLDIKQIESMRAKIQELEDERDMTTAGSDNDVSKLVMFLVRHRAILAAAERHSCVVVPLIEEVYNLLDTVAAAITVQGAANPSLANFLDRVSKAVNFAKVMIAYVPVAFDNLMRVADLSPCTGNPTEFFEVRLGKKLMDMHRVHVIGNDPDREVFERIPRFAKEIDEAQSKWAHEISGLAIDLAGACEADGLDRIIQTVSAKMEHNIDGAKGGKKAKSKTKRKTKNHASALGEEPPSGSTLVSKADDLVTAITRARTSLRRDAEILGREARKERLDVNTVVVPISEVAELFRRGGRS